jgi:hypothetical protein
MEFTPQGVDVLLLVVHSGELHQVVANGRVCAIRTNHEIESNLDFSGPAIGGEIFVACLKPSFVSFEISSGKLVVEEQLDIG